VKDLLERFRRLPAFAEAAARLARDRRAEAGGLWGSAFSVAAAALAEGTGRTVLAVTGGLEEADELADDALTFLPEAAVAFPAWETLPEEGVVPNARILADRVRALREIASAQGPLLVVAHAAALLQDVPAPNAIRSSIVELSVGEERGLSELAALLLEREYDRVPLVETPGEFSIRGGIVDVYPHAADPVRIEFFGDTIDSLRTFDPTTQASKELLKAVKLPLVRRSDFSSLGEGPTFPSLLDHLPADATVVLVEPVTVAERASRYLESAELDAGRWRWLCEGFDRFARLDLSSLPSPGGVEIRTHSLQRFTGDLASLLGELSTIRSQVDRVVVFCANPGERDRLGEMFEGTSLAGDRGIEARVGRLSRGFTVPELSLAFLPHHELFHRHRMRRVQQRLREQGRPIESYLELDRGDFVVHLTHGIGRFLGIERLVREGQEGEFLVVEYAENAKLYVPVSKVDLVQKYIGAGERAPQLSTLGTAGWERRKERVQHALEALSAEFLEIAAMRERELGIAYPKDTPWQREFEAAFPYEETEDQITSLESIKRDMESPRPMDRLICGDVGYGKTELAIRAAFKAAVHGKQVAVLVPTTILAQQHYQTFGERMADYPITVEVISRFRTRGKQREVLDRLKEGHVDILIGTHRLLGGDVKFKDLGLVIIDEEQRFGVDHKERLKKIRATVDVLTLTATPIPRTLHMALLGIRDISNLMTPPRDRRSISTEVARFDADRIRKAILLELNRDGQVFFVHNRVYNIEAIAAQIRAIVPEARIGIGHGQMHEDELEQIMLAFVERQIDVLVSTTIIESGLDIPNANTIFVNNADQFGLADLHQLRGRVGRYKHQAFAHFMVPSERHITPEAMKRLRAIEEFNELGAGFKIAMKDLEIRGAGSLLGHEQHGHIASVGYDLYCRLLEQAVKKARKQPIAVRIDTSVDLPVPSFLPTDYIADERQRLEVYRKFCRAASEEDVEAIGREMTDRFGEAPPEAKNLMELTVLRVLAQANALTNVALGEEAVIAKFADRGLAERLRKRQPGRVRIVDEETLHVVVSPAESAPRRLVSLLKRVLGGEAAAQPRAGRRT